MGRSLLRLMIVGLLCGSAAGAAPSSGPSLEQQVRELVKQLDSPRPSQRETAKAGLNQLDEEALPLLREAAQGASFEARVILEPVIEMLERSQQGAIVSAVLNRRTRREGIRPGDILFRVNNKYVASKKEFESIAEKERKGGLTVEFRTQEGHRVVKFEDETGCCLDDYAAAYGKPLIAALRAAIQAQYDQALEAFAQARAAGLDIDSAYMVRMWYLISLYYAGQREEAYRHAEALAAYLQAGGCDTPWGLMSGVYIKVVEDTLLGGAIVWPFDLASAGGEVPQDGHLGLYFRRQARKHHPESMKKEIGLAWGLEDVCHRYPEALAAWVTHLYSEEPSECSEWDERNWAVAHLCNIFQALDMDEEALQVCRFAVDHPSEFLDPSASAPLAEAAGDLQTAIALRLPKMGSSPNMPNYGDTPWKLLRLYVVTGQIDEVKAMLGKRPAAGVLVENMALRYNVQCGWHRLADTWAPIAVKAMEDETFAADDFKQSWIHYMVFSILQKQPEPDIAALDRAREIYLRRERERGTQDKDIKRWIALDDAIRGTYTGDFSALVAYLDLPETEKYFAKSPARPAAEFLEKHWSELTGTKELWRRTWHVYSFNDGRLFLLTRDLRLGRASADGSTIEEMPLPHPAWSGTIGTYSLNLVQSARLAPMRFSPSLTTLATVDEDRVVYAIRSNDEGWLRVMEVPFLDANTDRFEELNVMFDAIYDYARRHGPMIVSGCTRAHDNKIFTDEVARLVLRDGTRLEFDAKTGTIINLNERIAEKFGQRVHVYNMLELTGAPTAAYYFTDKGVLTLQNDGSIRQLALPDRDASVPVTLLKDGQEGQRYFGLLPDAGGGVYRLDPKSGAISPSGRINESYPVTFWLYQPAEWKRQQAIKAVQAAGHTWPIKWPSAASSSQPASAEAQF